MGKKLLNSFYLSIFLSFFSRYVTKNSNHKKVAVFCSYEILRNFFEKIYKKMFQFEKKCDIIYKCKIYNEEIDYEQYEVEGRL